MSHWQALQPAGFETTWLSALRSHPKMKLFFFSFFFFFFVKTVASNDVNSNDNNDWWIANRYDFRVQLMNTCTSLTKIQPFETKCPRKLRISWSEHETNDCMWSKILSHQWAHRKPFWQLSIDRRKHAPGQPFKSHPSGLYPGELVS